MEHGIFGTQVFEQPYTTRQRQRAWYGPFTPNTLASSRYAVGTGLGCAGCPRRSLGTISAAQGSAAVRFLLPALVGGGVGALATRGKSRGKGLRNKRVQRALAGAAAGILLGLLDPGGFLTDIGTRTSSTMGLSGVWLRPWSPRYPQRVARAMVL